MHLKSNKDSIDSSQKRSHRKSQNMASSLVNDDEDNASSTTRNTQQPQQQQQPTNNNNNTSCLNQQNNNNNTAGTTTANSTTANKMHGNEAKLKKENLQQRKIELEKLLNEKSWLLQQLQKQETQILNGNFEYMNFNDFIQNLAVQYKQEQTSDSVSSVGGVSQFTAGEEAILRRKPLTAKENQQHLHNVLHRRQSEISNRSSEYDNFPHHDNLSTHSDGASSAGRGGAGGSMTMQHAQAQQQYNAKSALKKRSATVAGTTQQQAAGNMQMMRQHHMEQQLLQQHQQQQQQHMLYKQQHYHQHPQQHLFKQHLEHHQVLMPHLQYATQKFYYTTLQPTPQQQQQQPTVTQQQQQQQQQQQYGRYIKAQSQAQAQPQQHHSKAHMHVPQNPQQQSPNHSQQHHVQYTTTQMAPTTSVLHQQQLLMTPPHAGAAAHMDNISLYSLNSNNVATLHRQAQQQQPIIVQCDKYYLSPTSHHVSHNDGGGFIKSSQNIKEYISPMNSPQQQLLIMAREKRMTSQTNLSNRGNTTTPSIDAISLAPSYVSMETVDYLPTTSQQQHLQNNLRWRSQTNLPPPSSAAMGMASADMKSHSSDMLNNNQYYNTTLNPPAPPTTHPPNVTQVKPFKPLDEISISSYSCETHKKTKSKQWLESSLDGPAIRQTPHQVEDNATSYSNNNNNTQQRSKLSSQSLNTSRHYSMSAAQAKPLTSTLSSQNQTTKLSQSTSYLNQMEATPPVTPSISQAYNVEITSPQTPVVYKYLSSSPGNHNLAVKPPARPPLYINAGATHMSSATASPTAHLSSGNVTTMVASSTPLSPDIRIESPKNMTVVQPATFQPYKEVTKPFEMSDFYKYSTKFRQKENNATQAEN